MNKISKPHIVLVVARGEAVRNFLYSDTLSVLSQNARVTLLSLVDHGEVMEHVRSLVDQIIPLQEYPEHRFVSGFQYLVHTAHYRWLWSENAKHMWALHDARAQTLPQKIRRWVLKFFATLFANRASLKLLTFIYDHLSWILRPTHDFEELFQQLQPDLVFNCSHIHGLQADLPLRIAHHMHIPTAAFVFSWDNLTTRSRILVPYDYYLMWNEGMKSQLLGQYRELVPEQVIVTGTPQFDFHFKPEYSLSREELCARIGIDPSRPFVLYTTGMDTDFLDEHKLIEAVIHILQESDLSPKPQLVVRTYIKGTSPEIQALAMQKISDVVFPPILWDKQWIMPLYEDLSIYSSLLHHCALGINAASTVSLELMMLNKPVINLGLEPPESNLPKWSRFARHVDYDHYRPVVDSGGVMMARSVRDLQKMILHGLKQPEVAREARDWFIQNMFGESLDGNSGKRVAEQIVRLACHL